MIERERIERERLEMRRQRFVGESIYDRVSREDRELKRRYQSEATVTDQEEKTEKSKASNEENKN